VTDEETIAAAFSRNDRYLREFIEALHICPYARSCREAGQLHRQVLLDRELDAPGVTARIRALDGRADIEIGLLIFPRLRVDPRAFERFIGEIRTRYGNDRTDPIGYFIVAFHPELPQQLHNANVAVRFLRRSPDPTIQLVRPSAIERARQGARDPEDLSRHIAEAGLRAVLAAGPERVAALLAGMRAPAPATPDGEAGSGR
jgi:hypothetical protein